MSNYKYTLASLAAGAQKGYEPKSDYVTLFQKTLDEQFYNASNWWTIQEETSIGSQIFRDVDVRISHVINAETGLKLGDDWKTLYFKSTSIPPELGRFYNFDDSIWLTTNIELYKNLTATCTIRRCNNTLRWIDEATGIFYEEPCAIEYLVKEPRDYATQGSPFKTPGGFVHIDTQFNSRTNLINENQRFLFGNPGHWTGYKVIGTGINDFRNTSTYNWEDARILTLDLIADFVNDELDDIVNGIADVNTNLYTISITEDSFSGLPGEGIQLHVDITYNNHSVTREVEWSSSNILAATVTSSGYVNFIATGNAVITANIKGNPASDTCDIIVSETPETNFEIRISPNKNYVLEGDTQIFQVFLYEDGAETPELLSITCDRNDVPSENYTFTGGSAVNSFQILNKIKDVNSYLTIECSSGSIVSKQYNIFLRGAWLYDTA